MHDSNPSAKASREAAAATPSSAAAAFLLLTQGHSRKGEYQKERSQMRKNNLPFSGSNLDDNQITLKDKHTVSLRGVECR